MRRLFCFFFLFVGVLLSNPTKLKCLSGTTEDDVEEVNCHAEHGCETQIISTEGEEGYRIILGCNERLKCGNTKTSDGYAVCCSFNLCNKGFRLLEPGLSARAAAEALAKQKQNKDELKTLPKPVPKPLVNPNEEDLKASQTTTQTPPSSPSNGLCLLLPIFWLAL